MLKRKQTKKAKIKQIEIRDRVYVRQVPRKGLLQSYSQPTMVHSEIK